MKTAKPARLALAILIGLSATAGRVQAQTAAFGNDGSQLPLNKRQLVKELSDTKIPDFVTYVEKSCGANVKVEVDWNSFATDENEDGLRAFNLHALEAVSGALDVLCTDDVGKAAVKKGLTTYQIKNVKPDQKKVNFAGGVLSMDVGFGAEWSEGKIEPSEVKELLQSKL